MPSSGTANCPASGSGSIRTGRKIYVVQSRGPRGSKRVTLGRHGELAAEQARKQAAAVIDRIKEGEDPVAAPPEPAFTVADLARRYLEAHVAVNCNAHTAGDLPGLARQPHSSGTGSAAARFGWARREAAALHFGLRDTPRAANRALMVLSKMFTLAEAWGLASPGGNPCRFVRKYKEGKRERFLAADEYRRIGRELCVLETGGVLPERAASALRLLILTGCRLGEILTLRWDDVDRGTGELRLRDAKTGARHGAAHTHGGGGHGEDCPCPAQSLGVRRAQAGQAPVAAHYVLASRAGARWPGRCPDPRFAAFSFASRALALGESLSMIGRLLGHTDIGSTARYAHLARDAEKAAAATVGDSIEADILPPEIGAQDDEAA